MTTEPHVIDLLPAYALGCLEPEEVPQVEEHLVACQFCQAKLRAYRQVVEQLPHAMRLSDPPPELKSRILDAAQKWKERSAAQIQPPLARRLSQALLHLAPAWGLVSAVLILLLLASNLFLWGRLSALEKAAQPRLASVTLYGTEITPDAAGVLVISRDGRQGTLVVDGLPGLQANQQYQLWLIQDGDRTSGGVFSVDQSGYAYLEIHAPLPLISFDAFGVTVEPYGGSPAPTGPKVLGGDFPG